MRYRRLFLLGLGLVLLAVLGSAYVAWLTAPRIGRVSYGQLRHGMTRDQVERLLGPPGSYETRIGMVVLEPEMDEYAVPDPPNVTQWRSDHGAIFVGFDELGRVNFTRFEEGLADDERLLDRLRRVLGLSAGTGPYVY